MPRTCRLRTHSAPIRWSASRSGPTRSTDDSFATWSIAHRHPRGRPLAWHGAAAEKEKRAVPRGALIMLKLVESGTRDSPDMLATAIDTAAIDTAAIDTAAIHTR